MSTSASTTTGTSGASKSVPRIVPWLNAEEWRETRKRLYSTDVDEIKLGLLQAKIWMDRGKVPTAVESTVNFLETILTDQSNLKSFLQSRSSDEHENLNGNENENVDEDAEETVESDRLLRLAYNTAVIRFVNELVDRAQKSLFATSITKLAEQIGLPRVFVDIRHDGTHDKLNSLELLRWAAWEALKWLEDQYWSFEDDFTPALWLSDFQTQVNGLIDQFCEQLEKINEVQLAASLEKSAHARITSQIDFLQTLPRIMKAFLTCLCERDQRRTGNVIEAVVRPLARNNAELFDSVVVDLLLEKRKETEGWIPWIVEEMKRGGSQKRIDAFASRILAVFAKKSSQELFKECIEKIWALLGPLVQNDRINKIHQSLSNVYSDNKKPQTLSKDSIAESRSFLQKRRYVEDENLEGWGEVNENWRPCPLGSSII